MSNGTSNIYLKVTIDKNWRSQNFDFQWLKETRNSLFCVSPKNFRLNVNMKIVKRLMKILKRTVTKKSNCVFL